MTVTRDDFVDACHEAYGDENSLTSKTDANEN